MSVLLAILILCAGYVATAALLCYLWGVFCVVAKIGWYDQDIGMAALALWPVGLPVILIMMVTYSFLSSMAWISDQAGAHTATLISKMAKRNDR